MHKDVWHVVWRGRSAEVRADRTVLLVDSSSGEKSLVVADTHLGKAAHFRARGLPVPEQTTRDTLERLSAALRQTGATALAVVGDFVHHAEGYSDETLDQIHAWRARHPDLKILNATGNHDRAAGDIPVDLCIEDSVEHRVAGWVLRHEFAGDPSITADEPMLTGHLHPAISLYAPGRPGMRMPCFWFEARGVVLPAFGAFTGMKNIRPGPGDRVLAVGPGSLVEVTPKPLRWSRPSKAAVSSASLPPT